MTRSGKPPRYKLISHPTVSDDLQALAAYGPDVIAAARAALDDLAHGRVTGKAVGERRVSSNLTGLARVKFDAPGSGIQRFRIVYADIDASTLGVLAIGVRDEYAIYRMAIKRIAAREEDAPSEREKR